MTDINTWNATDDSNNAAAPAGWPEGMMPSGVNNAARAMMGSLKRWRDQSQPTVTATGSGNAQIITYPVAPATLAAGDAFCFFALANTGAATLQVNAQAAKAVRTSIGTALIGGEMPAGAAIMVVYDGTNFRMLAAPTPLSVSNGGTGATTPGTAADAIGAVKDTGDTMTGNLTVPNVTYSGHAYGHAIAFGWDGGAMHMYVDGVDAGTVGDIANVAAGNGLTGGGASGAVTLSMSGSYTGNFSATGTVTGSYLSSTGNANVVGTISSTTVSTGTVTTSGGMTSNGGMQCNGNFTATGSVNGAYLSSSGGIAAASSLNTPVVNGGYGGSGTLQMHGTGNRICFRWDGGAGAAAWRVDETVEKYMCTTANVFDLQYAYPGGGPTNAVMGGHDVPGTWYYSYIDYTGSDERIKDNIADTEVDALGILQQVPVSQFDVKGAVAAWFRNMSLDTVERIASMRDAPPVHVPIGFVAQRVQPHIPDAVAVGRQDGAIPEAPLPVDMLNINRSEFVPYLVRAVQQLAARVEQLETALVR